MRLWQEVKVIGGALAVAGALVIGVGMLTTVSMAAHRHATQEVGPALGGTPAAFSNAYGAPVTSDAASASYHVTGAANTPLAGFHGTVEVTLEAGHVRAITITPDTGSAWGGRVEQAFLTLYNPSDAHEVSTDWSLPNYYGRILSTSASLAHTFPASDFTPCGAWGCPPAGEFHMTVIGSHMGTMNGTSITYALGV